MSDTEHTDDHKQEALNNRDNILQSISETLKNSRFDQSISLKNVEKTLHIRQIYLQAFESGDWSALPGEMYDIGFLRQYAKHLGCNIDELINQLKLNQYALTKPAIYPDPPIAPSKKWVIACAIGFLILLIAFNVFKSQPTPLPSQMLQKQTQNIPQKVKSIEANKPKMTQQDAAPASSPTPEASVQAKPTKLEQHTDVPAQVATPPIAQKKPTNTQHHYQFTAVLDKVWLQIYSVKPHTLLREALLHMGQSIHLDAQEPLSITCGNLPALEVRMDQKLILQAGSIAKNKQVVHDFLLHPTDKP